MRHQYRWQQHLKNRTERLLRQEKEVFSTLEQTEYWAILQLLADNRIPQRGYFTPEKGLTASDPPATRYHVCVNRGDFIRAVQCIEKRQGLL